MGSALPRISGSGKSLNRFPEIRLPQAADKAGLLDCYLGGGVQSRSAHVGELHLRVHFLRPGVSCASYSSVAGH